jgi:alpha-beta hydrolase superfamily lysophospholipase
VTIVVVVVVLAVIVGTFMVTEEIDSALLEVKPPILDYAVEVVGVDAAAVTLERTEASVVPGRWGLEWDTGYARVGDVLSDDGTSVTRILIEASGSLRPGTPVAIDRFAFASDPGDLGIDFDDIEIEGPLGDYPAWQIDGSDDTWVIFVHGRDGYRRESLRLLGTVVEQGLGALVITYRNDPPAPQSPNRRHSLGKHEWKDLEAAVEYAVGAGAADVVLVGYGMGGAVTGMFLRESEWAPRVQGLVLDAPLLDPAAVAAEDAADRDVPGFILGMAKGLAGLRYGVDWGRLDQIGHADEFELPVLLFHGDADEVVPLASSEAFAEAADEIVRLEVVSGAGHGAAWNADPDRYDAATGGFLAEVAGGPSDLDPLDEDTLEELGVLEVDDGGSR